MKNLKIIHGYGRVLAPPKLTSETSSSIYFSSTEKEHVSQLLLYNKLLTILMSLNNNHLLTCSTIGWQFGLGPVGEFFSRRLRGSDSKPQLATGRLTLDELPHVFECQLHWWRQLCHVSLVSCRLVQASSRGSRRQGKLHKYKHLSSLCFCHTH